MPAQIYRIGKEGVPLYFILIPILFTGFGVAYALLEQRFKQRELSRPSASQRPAIALRRTAASGIPISEGLYGRSVSIRGAFVAGQLLHHWRNEENSYGRGFAHTGFQICP